ncbi:galactose oxidase [Gigaspora margarita]|uniref:Galactose oxidase n=1 Tax=Gigaspora margarita TaxID=4874 RepID=A0A8H3XFZ1_GIGMA|nr:galactose oxidase [Gigaspora margarita]
MKLPCYILFFVIFSSAYFFVICQNVPSPRRQHASALIGTRAYFFGGEMATSRSNEVWYLDLSSSFNILTPPWHNDGIMPVGYNLGSSCLSPFDNSTVFLVGGRTWIITATTYSYSYTSSVYKFDSKTSQWSKPNINNFNSNFASRDKIQSVIDSNGKIFIFGGANYNNSIYYNDMNILDITTMTWSTQIQSVPTYLDYTATLLPNGFIIYIGGHSGSNSIVNLNILPSLNINMQLQIFDTKSYTWSNKLTGGSIIASRAFHSAVLTQDGNIIIYGGSTTLDSSLSIDNVFSDIAVLNTNTWVWSVPSISGPIAPPLARHSATLYKTYMILAFGSTSNTILYTNNIYIIDIQNYTWVTTFNINIPTTTNSPTVQSNSNSQTRQEDHNSSTYILELAFVWE